MQISWGRNYLKMVKDKLRKLILLLRLISGIIFICSPMIITLIIVFNKEIPFYYKILVLILNQITYLNSEKVFKEDITVN